MTKHCLTSLCLHDPRAQTSSCSPATPKAEVPKAEVPASLPCWQSETCATRPHPRGDGRVLTSPALSAVPLPFFLPVPSLPYLSHHPRAWGIVITARQGRWRGVSNPLTAQNWAAICCFMAAGPSPCLPSRYPRGSELGWLEEPSPASENEGRTGGGSSDLGAIISSRLLMASRGRRVQPEPNGKLAEIPASCWSRVRHLMKRKRGL